MKFYRLKLKGVSRDLPIVSLGPKIKIASFNLLGDGELVEAVSKALVKKLREVNFDVLLGPEVKVVPLLHSLSGRLKKPRYVILRKNIMGYMVRPVSSKTKPSLVVNGVDAEYLRGKKVVIIDDVVSTGRTINVVKEVAESVGAEVVLTAAVLKQGEQKENIDAPFFYLRTLPVFNT